MYARMHLFGCAWACVCVCVCVCACVRICVYVYAYLCNVCVWGVGGGEEVGVVYMHVTMDVRIY